MEFRIFRTGYIPSWKKIEAPCDGAYQKDPHSNNWFIDIKNLDELLSLGVRVGYDLIINTDGIVPVIEIYDAWRE